MKKVLLLVIAILTVSFSFGQDDYNKWAVEGDFGLHAVGDESADLRDIYNHFGATLRYNINPKFGLGLSYGKDNLSLSTFEGANVNTEYNRYNLEGFIDIFDVLDLQNNVLTMIAHGGGGISTIDAHETDYYQSVFNMRGGISALFKLSRTMAFKIDASTTVNIGQDKTLDGNFDISNAGINSTVDNLTAGLVVYLGKKRNGKKVQHADWYVAPKPVYTIVENITNEAPITNITQVINKCDCSANENVYFENDLPKVGTTGETLIGIQGLNAIEKIANLLNTDANATVELRGSASPTDSTTYAYDLALSERRVDAVASKLVELGVSPARITTSYFGKDTSRGDIHEFARKVSLVVK